MSLGERNNEALHRYHTLNFLHMIDELEKAAGGSTDGQRGEAAAQREAGHRKILKKNGGEW